jgi:hypothetical protein
MELLENALLSINGAELFSVFGEAIYEDLLDQAETLGYPMSKAQRPYAFDLLNSLMAVVPTTEKTREMGQSFETRVSKLARSAALLKYSGGVQSKRKTASQRSSATCLALRMVAQREILGGGARAILCRGRLPAD